MPELSNIPYEQTAAFLAAAAVIIVAVLSVTAQLILWFLDKREARKQEILTKRKEVLLSALEVIDHVYANTKFNNRSPHHPYAWDISLARDAMNGMIIFCADPQKTVTSFAQAIGLHNPDTQSTGTYSPRQLAEFRSEVCRELECSDISYESEDITWISRLPGAE